MQTNLFKNVEAKQFSPDEKMLALSWKEPFGSLMLHGKIETRTWATKYRGPVLICTSAKPYEKSQVFSISGAEQTSRIIKTLGIDYHSNAILGKAIAIGWLTDCRPMTKADEDKCFVEYYPERFCHIYEKVQPIYPFVWKGCQGWKIVPDEMKRIINFK